ncbi:transposase, MuDR, MULE transposase domain protein [Artemisia annua]|uniref:Transposase, MuDR, MULE transposase domain protein n=1 Tax=Artemisia annua TaxID=35608 RepID=A0A2U1LN17_ARTAN|nr:transposase, MuDR, MULE transposase domain protein [Artemisia annua]
MTTKKFTVKFRCFLVCQSSTRKVFLPNSINYFKLVNYCKQKFNINAENMISLSYRVGSEVIDVNDDDDVECFVSDFSNVSDEVPTLSITLHDTNTYSSCKSPDFDLNEPFIPDESSQNNRNQFFSNMPHPPHAPEIILQNNHRCNLENRVPCSIKLGDKFKDKEECMLSIGKKAIIEGFEYYVVKSCKKRYSVRCSIPGCSWNIYTRKFKSSNHFKVTSLHPIHTCSVTQLLPNHRNASNVIIGHMIVVKLRDNRRVYTGKDIKKDFNIDWKIDISYHRAWTGKNYALKLLHGSHEESFAVLPKYFYNLKMANSGTVTHIDTDVDGRFKMCFLGFGVSIRSFLNYMRPLIKIDVAHLKGRYLATNLIAVGMDANNQIIPLATGVAQGETVESWSWFLGKLKECIGDRNDLAIISDRHFAITIACKTVFPRAFHRYCCRHLMMNCNLKSRKHKALFWKTCKAYLVSDFDSAIAEIWSFKPDAYRKLEEAGFDKWSRAYCPAKRYNYLTSNSAESINSLTKNVRKVPVTMLIEYYRELIQQWYCDRRYNGEVNDRMIKSATWVFRGIRHGKIYQVRDSRSVHTVNLTEGECSCRKWQLSGLPCGYICAVARFSGMSNCNHWAKGWFSQKTQKRTYRQLVHPLKEPWETPGDVQVILPPAIVKRQPGRPKENQRIKSQGEEPRIVRCSRCGVAGHYRDACREPLPSQNVRRTATTNNEPDACEEMDYDQNDASMDDVMDYSQYTSSTAYNESSMGDMMDFSSHIQSHDYYYPQFND